MGDNTIARVITAVMFVGWSYSVPAQSSVKPSVTLFVSSERLQLPQVGGSTSFRVDAVADRGVEGLVSGTISISDPANGDNIDLAEGFSGRNIAFSIGPGHRISETTVERHLTFTVRTSGTNQKTGLLTYSVFLNPSKAFEGRNTPKQVTVRVVPSKAP